MLYHRKKISGIEVDLILISPQRRIVCVEVKTNSAEWSVGERIKRAQLERLFAVERMLSSWLRETVTTEIVLCGKAIDVYRLEDLIR